eukprot:1207156-Pyramimonas_sp.AAC.1
MLASFEERSDAEKPEEDRATRPQNSPAELPRTSSFASGSAERANAGGSGKLGGRARLAGAPWRHSQ